MSRCHVIFNRHSPILAKGFRMSELLTTAQVAAMTGYAVETLRWYRQLGDRGPKSFSLGRKVVYERADVEAWIAECKRVTAVGGVA